MVFHVHTTPLRTGDVVFGYPDQGRPVRRKGVVLGSRSVAVPGKVVVWWFRMGPAEPGHSVYVVKHSRLVRSGSVRDLSLRTSRDLLRGCGDYDRAQLLADMLDVHIRSMTRVGASFPVTEGQN